MIDNPTVSEYQTLLRQDFSSFAARCFHELNPQTALAMNWHVQVIAEKLTAVRQGKIRRLIINLPPRHLKSLMASIEFQCHCRYLQNREFLGWSRESDRTNIEFFMRVREARF